MQSGAYLIAIAKQPRWARCDYRRVLVEYLSMQSGEYLMAIGLNVTTWVWAQGGTHATSAGGDQVMS
jgi:hypothetical protein